MKGVFEFVLNYLNSYIKSLSCKKREFADSDIVNETKLDSNIAEYRKKKDKEASYDYFTNNSATNN
ncbi:hypothetical protein ACHJH3_11000 [Campylobacter sp. MOP7]|uniref:hypothetical protein n=1 Tax=Campylobacter canis TaxID=3378588 RepID=UPI00387E3946